MKKILLFAIAVVAIAVVLMAQSQANIGNLSGTVVNNNTGTDGGSGCTPTAGTICANAFDGLGAGLQSLILISIASVPSAMVSTNTGLVTLNLSGAFTTPPSLTTNTALQALYLEGNLSASPNLSTNIGLATLFLNTNAALASAPGLTTNVGLMTVNMSGDALPAAQVNQVLADLVTCCLMNAGAVDLSGGTNAAPTGAGITAAAALSMAGWTVITN